MYGPCSQYEQKCEEAYGSFHIVLNFGRVFAKHLFATVVATDANESCAVALSPRGKSIQAFQPGYLMFKNLVFLFCFANVSILVAQDSLNMIRLARWDDDSLPIASPNSLRVQYSGCWGLAVNGREYAVLGGARHVLIFDITIPTNPQLVAKYEGETNTVWREFKSYKNRIYGVSDATNEGLMIFDFSNAPDTIKRTYYSNLYFSSAHTITLDTMSGRIYLNGQGNHLKILDISQNPDKPVLLGAPEVFGGYIHDSFVQGDTVYASSGFGGYFIYDCTDPDTAALITSLPTDGGYHHNSWLSKDSRYAYCTIEIPSGRPILIVDLQDIANSNIEIVGSFLDQALPAGDKNAIPHNVYIRDSLLFDSQYEDGLLVYNISNPTAPVLVAYYDTHPENTQYNNYFGCWGNYPWLPSGTIIAGDMQNGLQLLKIASTSSIKAEVPSIDFRVFPNPATDDLNIHAQDGPEIKTVRVVCMTGQVVYEQQWPAGAQGMRFSVAPLPSGLYFIEVRAKNGAMAVKKVHVD